MNIFIPVVGDELLLKNNITTNITFAGQNKRFIKKLVGDESKLSLDDEIEINLLENTVLKVERVYVRQGAGADFNSITFRIPKDNPSCLPDGRFFIPIDIVNTFNVDKIVNLNNEKPKTFRDFTSELHMKADINQRMDKSYSTPAFKEVDELPVALSGNIIFNLREESEKVKSAITACLKDNNLDSVESLLIEAEKYITEDSFAKFEKRLHEAEYSINRIANHVQTENYPVYRFKLKYRNGEPLLVLSKYGRFFFDALHTYTVTIHALLNVLVDKYVRPIQTFHSLMSNPYGKENFGEYTSKANTNTKPVLKDASEKIGILPKDAFTDNLFTRTKSDDHGYVFHYELDNGNKLSISEMRKEIRSLAKDFSS